MADQGKRKRRSYPQAWRTDVLGRIPDHKIARLDELMPWRYAALAT